MSIETGSIWLTRTAVAPNAGLRRVRAGSVRLPLNLSFSTMSDDVLGDGVFNAESVLRGEGVKTLVSRPCKRAAFGEVKAVISDDLV